MAKEKSTVLRKKRKKSNETKQIHRASQTEWFSQDKLSENSSLFDSYQWATRQFVLASQYNMQAMQEKEQAVYEKEQAVQKIEQVVQENTQMKQYIQVLEEKILGQETHSSEVDGRENQLVKQWLFKKQAPALQNLMSDEHDNSPIAQRMELGSSVHNSSSYQAGNSRQPDDKQLISQPVPSDPAEPTNEEYYQYYRQLTMD